MAATTFFTKLINVGINPREATILETQYSNEPDFTDGLEVIASWMALKVIPSAAKPTAQPWRDIYDNMLKETQAGIDIDHAFTLSLTSYDPMLAIALTQVVGVRMKAIIDFEQRKGKAKNFKGKDYITQLTQLGYNFKKNLVTGEIEVNGEPITDELAAKIRVQLRDAGLRQSKEAEDAYTAYAWDQKYHPIRDYLENLPAWDGTDYFSQVVNCFSNPDGNFPKWFRRWLIGAIAKPFQKTQNRMLILDGPQGAGKSKFVEWLCSGMPKYFVSMSINPDDKDSLIRLTDKWIGEVPELGSTTRRTDREALKAFLTREEATFRRPYGKYAETKPALCSFIGTFNYEHGLLNDPTGSRRFLICRVVDIDWKEYLKIDINMLWSQMWEEYRAGENWDLSPDERILSEQFNRENYETPNPLEDLILNNYSIDLSHMTLFETASSILEFVKSAGYKYTGSDKSLSMEIASVLGKYGLRSTSKYLNGKSQRIYEGISK